jgi:hypothetical protein
MNEPTESAPDLATARAAFCEAQEKAWHLEAAAHAAWLQYIDSYQGSYQGIEPGQALGGLAAFRSADRALQLAQGVLGQARAAYRAAVLAAESGGR